MDWVIELKAEDHSILDSPKGRACPFKAKGADADLDNPKYANDPRYAKPSASYAALITTAIRASEEQKLTLNDIYEWIMATYPYYAVGPPGWKVCCAFHVLCVCCCAVVALRCVCGVRVRARRFEVLG